MRSGVPRSRDELKVRRRGCGVMVVPKRRGGGVKVGGEGAQQSARVREEERCMATGEGCTDSHSHTQNNGRSGFLSESKPAYNRALRAK